MLNIEEVNKSKCFGVLDISMLPVQCKHIFKPLFYFVLDVHARFQTQHPRTSESHISKEKKAEQCD